MAATIYLAGCTSAGTLNSTVNSTDDSSQTVVETMTPIQSDVKDKITPETETTVETTTTSSQEVATETKMGYLTSIDWVTYLCSFDEIQRLTHQNEDELRELEIDPDSLPNGFYIYNAEEEEETLSIDYNCKFAVIRGDSLYDVSLADFRHSWEDHLNYDSPTPYIVELQDNIIVSISEQYAP
jgi:hypothetical protein